MTETTRTETQMWAVALTRRDCVLAEVGLEYLAETYNEWSGKGTERAAFWAEKANDCITALAHLKERTYMHIDEDAADTPALRCDHCYQPVVVVGSEYKHYDPYSYLNGSRPTWYQCLSVDADTSRATYCEVNGRDTVPEEVAQ